MMRVEILSQVEEIQRIATAWRTLCQRSRSNWIFSLPEWHLAWWTTIGSDREMRILAAYREHRLVGLLPLAIRRGAWREGKIRLLEFSGGSQSDQQDAIVDPDSGQEVLDAISQSLKLLSSEVDAVRLQNVPVDSPTVDRFLWKSRPFTVDTPNPVLRLSGDYEKLERGWRASHRGDVRRQRRRLEKEGSLALEVVQDKNRASRMLEDFFTVYRRKWELDGDRRVLNNPLLQGPLQQFYQALLDSLGSKDGVHFSVLTLSGRPISYHFGFLYEGRLYWYRPTYDMAYENFSPSKVHVALLMELGCREGWREFDFLLGAEPYKYAWTQEERHVRSFVFKGTRSRLGGVAAWWMGPGQIWGSRVASSGVLQRFRSSRFS